MNRRVAHFQVGSVVTGDERTVALRQDHDFLLDVFNFIFGFFEIDNLDGHHLLGPVVDPFEHFAEGSLADPLLFGEDQLRIHFLLTKQQQTDGIITEEFTTQDT